METELPDIPVGEQRYVGNTIYIHPKPYVEHEHEYIQISETEWQCKHCPSGQIRASL